MILQFHWFSLGALAMMLGYMLFQYAFLKRKEYIYFSLYLLFTLLSFFLIIQFYEMPNRSSYALSYAAYSTIPLFSFIAYLLFMEHLLDIRSSLPTLSRIIKGVIYLLGVVILIDLWSYLILKQYTLHTLLANGSRSLVILTGITGSLLLLGKVGREGWFFISGSLVLAAAGIITTFMNINPDEIDLVNDALIHTGIFYYRMGILVQLLLFAMGISYKSRKIEKRKAELEIELIKEKFEHQLERRQAIESTRAAIAGDLHDDIGATLSSINIYSKLAGDKLKKDSGKAEPLIEKIRVTTQELMNNMSDAIWSIRPEDDTTEKLAFRLKLLMQEFLEPAGIHYSFGNNLKTDEPLPMELRRNLYLIAKEAINNIAKYSNATAVEVQLVLDGDYLEMSIRDNGKGFDLQNHHVGNGLRNMSSRTKQAGGEIAVESSPGAGTTIRASVPITKINY